MNTAHARLSSQTKQPWEGRGQGGRGGQGQTEWARATTFILDSEDNVRALGNLRCEFASLGTLVPHQAASAELHGKESLGAAHSCRALRPREGLAFIAAGGPASVPVVLASGAAGDRTCGATALTWKQREEKRAAGQGGGGEGM